MGRGDWSHTQLNCKRKNDCAGCPRVSHSRATYLRDYARIVDVGEVVLPTGLARNDGPPGVRDEDSGVEDLREVHSVHTALVEVRPVC